MIDKDFKTKIKTFSNKELLEQIDFMTEGYYSDLIEICLEELRCRLEATEWHYPSKGELPDKDVECLVRTTSGNNFIAMIDSSDNCWCTGEFFSESLRDDCVECWQYIVPPKIENLKCHAKVTIKGADNNNIEGERKNDKL